jgi:hypothetical protein
MDKERIQIQEESKGDLLAIYSIVSLKLFNDGIDDFPPPCKHKL